MSEEPTCREVVELITTYLERKMPADERRAFEEHLDACEGCRNYLDQVRTTIRLSRKPAEESLPRELQEQLVAAFRRFKPA